MATNKHAIIRYQALDACFSNKYKRFFIEDLIKPLHQTQAVIDNENCIIRLKVFLTWELEALILSFGDHVEVLEPPELRDVMKATAENLAKKYNCAI